jgi:hypothetical protein
MYAVPSLKLGYESLWHRLRNDSVESSLLYYNRPLQGKRKR